jgi:hypothetical protein
VRAFGSPDWRTGRSSGRKGAGDAWNTRSPTPGEQRCRTATRLAAEVLENLFAPLEEEQRASLAQALSILNQEP